MIVSMMLAVGITLMLMVFNRHILNMYQLSAASRELSEQMMVIVMAVLWSKAANMVLNMGILRAGGDTLFSMALDLSGMWLIGIPLALVGAFIFQLPVAGVVALLVMEEIIKTIVGLHRLATCKWIHNLANDDHQLSNR